MSTLEQTDISTELWPLLSALCDEQLPAEGYARLEELVLSSPANCRAYVNYLDLHGTLAWNAGYRTESATDDHIGPQFLEDDLRTWAAGQESLPQQQRSWITQRWNAGLAAAIAVCVLLSWGLANWWLPGADASGQQPVLAANQHPSREIVGPSAPNPGTQPANSAANGTPKRSFDAVVIAQGVSGKNQNATPAESDLPSHDKTLAATQRNDQSPATGTNSLDQEPASQQQVVSFINDQLGQRWKQVGVEPSPLADDAEWLRRVSLDVVGYIPPVTEVDRFLSDKSPRKRREKLNQLLDDPGFARNMAVIWGNLLVGRSPRPEVNRPALLAFLRQSFERNRPWPEIVYDLVAAEGRVDENGAANFLVAHLNGGAIPATSITARLFLGMQLQCAQCHNHPFNDWKQEQFWAFNSFFQQAEVVRLERRDPVSGRMEVASVTLRTKEIGGPVYFETRNGLMKVAYPAFQGQKIDAGESTNRRNELARLMTQGEISYLAPAFVNRIWAHFLGRAFTPVVDDLSPHIPPSHPELLDRLSEEFVRSQYDIKALIRWVCLSDAYQRSSRFGDKNLQDDPERGELPLFSRVYVKPLSAEQLYDSLQVATTGSWVSERDAATTEQQQVAWMQQFVRPFETEENDEATTFEGSITQSLLMMNGELVHNATRMEPGTWLHQLIISKKSDTDRIQALFKAALSRPASQKELAAARKLLHTGGLRGNPEEAYQDLYWAFLNSNEFILNH